MESSILTKSKKKTKTDEINYSVGFESNGVQKDIPKSSCETLSGYGTFFNTELPTKKNVTCNTSDKSLTFNQTTSTVCELNGISIIFTSACFLGFTATAISSSQTKYGYDSFQTVNLIDTQLSLYSTIYIISFSSFKKMFSELSYEHQVLKKINWYQN